MGAEIFLGRIVLVQRRRLPLPGLYGNPITSQVLPKSIKDFSTPALGFDCGLQSSLTTEDRDTEESFDSIVRTVSFLVGQRAGEIGMRMALGARAADVLRMVLYQGGVLACMGLTIGLLSAWTLTRVLRSHLFEVSPVDPFTYAAVSCLLLAVALIASYFPARRGSRIDPMVALRSE